MSTFKEYLNRYKTTLQDLIRLDKEYGPNKIRGEVFIKKMYLLRNRVRDYKSRLERYGEKDIRVFKITTVSNGIFYISFDIHDIRDITDARELVEIKYFNQVGDDFIIEKKEHIYTGTLRR